MAFIPGFEHDIFISYARVNNLVASPDKPRWVDRFHKELEILLAQRIGRTGLVKIWRDERIEGNQLFDNTIQSAIDTSALFITLTSNGYLASDYCKKELQAFHKKAQAERYGLRIGDRFRIFNALLNNISDENWPREYGRITGYPFHDAEESDAFGDTTEVTDKKFRNQLRKLSDDLYKMLIAFKETAGRSTIQKTGKESLSSEDVPCVFVADVSDSLRPVRTRTINELQRKGITIAENIPPPYKAGAHEATVRNALRESALSVHLLDGYSGREIEGDPSISYPQKQVELAKGNVGAQIIWTPGDIDLEKIEDERQKAFLTQLERGDRAQASYDFIRGSHVSLVDQILEKIKQLQTASRTRSNTQAVLLDTHKKDQLYALELSKFFLSNNIQPYINPQEDDPGRNMDALEARLREVSMLTILFGSVNEIWVRRRLGAALQLCVTKNFPIQYFCVLAIPPEKRSLSFNLGPIPVHFIDNSKNNVIEPGALKPVLQLLQKGESR